MRLNAGMMPAPVDETSLEDLLARCRRDVDSGGYIRFDIYVWVAFKL